MRSRIMVLMTLVMLLTAERLSAECTERDRAALTKSGMSGYEIAKLCGDIKEGTVPREEERVRPKRPDSHGRLQERTDICQTDAGWCVVAEAAPPGLSCQCRTAHSVYQGVLVRR
jgi:hypothetical protein